MSKGKLFGVLAGVSAGAVVGIVVIALAFGSSGPPPDDTAKIASLRSAPHVFVRETAGSNAPGRVAIRALDPSADSALTALSCERFYFAAGTGICLAAQPGIFSTYAAVLLDENLEPTKTVPLTGIPSRARVSPDGKYAAATVFVSGHSYAGGGFSTQTQIIDAASGETVANLEDYSLFRDGVQITQEDINYWGVTFTDDSDVFYATVGTSGQRYLVRGNVTEGRMDILAENVECPSLSPDGTMIAYKRRVRSDEALVTLGRPFTWQIHAMRLDDLVPIPLGETRDIDDQVEWLDNSHVLYGYDDPQTGRTSIYQAAVDASAPVLYAANAESPAVIDRAAVGRVSASAAAAAAE